MKFIADLNHFKRVLIIQQNLSSCALRHLYTLSFNICVAIYISPVSIATEEIGLAADEWRGYLDSGYRDAYKL